MKKKGLTHLIATDKGNITKAYNGLLLYSEFEYSNSNITGIPQYLYITTDEEIKEGDWCIDIDSVGRNTLTQAKEWKLLESLKYIGARKVVATDNHKLWYIDLPELHGIPAGKGVNIPKIPTSFLKEYVEKQPKEVWLEYNPGGYRHAIHMDSGMPPDEESLKLNQDGSVIISPVEERMYTRTDMNSILLNLLTHLPKDSLVLMQEEERVQEYINKWFDENYS